jgi:hypothetical protein
MAKGLKKEGNQTAELRSLKTESYYFKKNKIKNRITLENINTHAGRK